jgi:hypothetical protein
VIAFLLYRDPQGELVLLLFFAVCIFYAVLYGCIVLLAKWVGWIERRMWAARRREEWSL